MTNTTEAVKAALDSGMIKPAGASLLEHLKSLPAGKAMLVVPHDPEGGFGYTIRTVDHKTDDS
jgi:hypothetical protein